MRIHTLDLEYLGLPEAVASYVVDAPGGPVMIETGPHSCVNALAAGLAKLSLTPEDVRHVLVTHIHLDHAGAAWWMAERGATIYVHEFGAPHLIDPTKLHRSAERIYGDQLSQLWGELRPVAADRVASVRDGEIIRPAGLALRAVETPGHAKHHHAWIIEADDGRIAFTGDAAACSVRETPGFISLPTPPPEFDLEAWHTSIDRLRRESPDVIFPTHFGEVRGVAAHLDRVDQALDEHAAFVAELMSENLDRNGMLQRYRDWFVGQAERAGMPDVKQRFYVKSSVAEMNVAGIERYWNKRAEQGQASAPRESG